MKILIAIVAMLLVVVIGIVIAASLQPEAFHIERSVVIERPPARVFAFIGDFRNYAAWNPWERLDPGMKKTLNGPPATVGTTYEWDGNDKVGAGKMEILTAAPDAKLTVKLDFLRPFASTATATWTTAAEAGGTRMTWAMDGFNKALPQKIFGMLMMEGMLGRDFEVGLSALKAALEKAP